MKHHLTIAGFTTIVIMLFSCQKEELDLSRSLTENSENKSIKNTKKKDRLKEFEHWGRRYVMFYNNRNELDSVVAKHADGYSYVYRVFYTASRMDSIQLIDRGKLVSVTTNIRYKGDLIIQTDYWSGRANGQPFPEVRQFTYDNKKRILNSTIGDQFTYDENGFLISTVNTRIPSFTASFNSDDRPNPLHNVPYLFLVMIEDYNMAQFCYNPYNVVKETRATGLVINYQNQYDQDGRLVKKSWAEGNFAWDYHEIIYTYE